MISHQGLNLFEAAGAVPRADGFPSTCAFYQRRNPVAGGVATVGYNGLGM